MTNINFFRVGQVFAQAQAAIGTEQEAFTLPDGALYQTKDAHSYIQRQVKFPLDLIVADGRIVGAQTPSRETGSLLIAPEHCGQTLLPRWDPAYPNPPCARTISATPRRP